MVLNCSRLPSACAQIPVALAMWNQVAAECILLIRTYAFFNRNTYILVLLVSALSGVVSYQLYVATSQMDRKYPHMYSSVSMPKLAL